MTRLTSGLLELWKRLRYGLHVSCGEAVQDVEEVRRTCVGDGVARCESSDLPHFLPCCVL